VYRQNFASLKTLILIRHAKSDWNAPSLGDFDRPLNERGKRDAPVMAQRLLDRKIKIDAFISSPAKRAKKTATVFAEAYKKDKDDLVLVEELYGAEEEAFFKAIADVKKSHDTIAVFSHNPGITAFANLLSDTRIDNIPTCGVFAVKIHADKWSEVKDAKKEFLFFDFPKAE